jgi:hypothetical protein
MNAIKALAVAALMSVSAAGFAVAQDSGQSPLDSLTSTSSLSFETVAGPEVLSANSGANMEQVDLDSLKALIEQNPTLLAQLESYGATIDQVVGISAGSETDVTIYVQGDAAAM